VAVTNSWSHNQTAFVCDRLNQSIPQKMLIPKESAQSLKCVHTYMYTKNMHTHMCKHNTVNDK